MKIKKLVKLAPMMLLTFLLGLSGCSGSTSADARVNDHPNEADEELHVLTIGTADSGGTMYPVGSALASVLSGHDEQLKVNLSASNGSYTNVENIKNGRIFRSSGRIPAGDRGRLFKPVHLDGAGIRAYLLRS